MRAAWYERNGDAAEVLSSPRLGREPLRRQARAGTTCTIAFPRVIPDSDGAGVVDRAGPGVDAGRVGSRVWVYNGGPVVGKTVLVTGGAGVVGH